jgi:hypothetical protein
MARTTRSNQVKSSPMIKPSTKAKPSAKVKPSPKTNPSGKVLNHLHKAKKRQAFDETIREALVAKMMMFY